jgi:hypothetical protein
VPRFRLARRGRAAGSIPANSAVPRFDNSAISGSAVTAPIAGQRLFFNPGTWSNAPTSYTGQVYVAGVAYDSPQSWNAGDPVPTFLPGDDIAGSALRLGVTATNAAGSSSEVLSTATTALANINLASAAPVLTRSSSSAATPFTVSMAALSSSVYEGYVVQRVISTSNTLDSDGNFVSTVYDHGVYLTASTVAAPNTISWPAFDDSSYSQLYEMRRILVQPTEAIAGTYLSPWSNIVKKSDALTNTTAYTKYRLSVTDTPSGFYTNLAEFKVAATPGGADTANNSGVTISASNAAGGAAANARDGNTATYWATDFGGGVAYPHILTLDYTAGTAIAANEFKLTCENSSANGFPRNFTIDGWNGSSWVNLLTQTAVTATAGETKTYVL